MSILVNDSLDTGGIVVRLSRLDNTNGDAHPVFMIDTGDTETPGKTSIWDATGTGRLINNNRFGWYLFVRFDKPSTILALFSIRITYQ